MSIRELVARIRATPDCTVVDPIKRSDLHYPTLHQGHVFPNDLREFYDICGGVSLFERSPSPMAIVPPMGVLLANAVLFYGMTLEQLVSTLDDISWTWYLIASNDSGEYLTIDLHQQRLGRCYNSFIGYHANPGYSTIVAFSFTELLTRLYENKGQTWLPNVISLGDAYDGTAREKEGKS